MIEVLLLLLGITVGIAIGITFARMRLAEQRREFDERMELLAANRQQLADQMKSISNEVMRATARQLEADIERKRQLEQEQAKHELDRHSAEIRNAVNPVKETLTEVKTKVDLLEQQRAKAQGELGQQIESLREGVNLLAESAGGLTAALRKPSGRGSWGEIQLRNVIELAGMIEHCDFQTQVSVETEDGRLRPDVIVNMPGGKTVVVDAKAPMEAFLEAQEASDDELREEQLRKHASQVKRHIDALRAKSYQQQFESSPELVVMFIPSEGIYHAALSADPRLLEHGLQERVLIATPTTLIGLLRAINYGWGQQRIAESAEEIAALGRELHKRMAVYSGHLGRVGKSLNATVGHFNQAVASYDSRVMPHLRKIDEAGAGSGRELADVAQVETTAREVTAPPLEGDYDFSAELEYSDDGRYIKWTHPVVPPGREGEGWE